MCQHENHTGHAIEPPESTEHIPAALRGSVVLIALLVAALVAWEWVR